MATDDTSLRLALDDSTVTCIEVEGTIQLLSDLPGITDDSWTHSDRELHGLTLFGGTSGTSPDGIAGQGHKGIELIIDDGVDQLAHDARLAVSGLTLSGFVGSYGAGALYATLDQQPVDLHIEVDGVVMEGNSSAGNYGGAIYAGTTPPGGVDSSVYVTVGNSRFEYNSALKYGGAIYAYADDDTVIVDIDSSTFTHNDAAVHGGAVFAKSNSGYERVDVGEGSEFAHNHAGGAGGAVHSHGLVRVAGLPSDPVTFSDDTAGFGGAILTRLGGAITGAVFERNIGGDGGAVYSYGNLAVADSTFSENRAIGTHGGALSVDGDLSLERSAVVGNYAKFNGGGLIVFGDVARVDNSFIGGNRAGDIAGAIWMDLPSSNVLELNFSTVYDDTVLPGGSGPSGIQTGSIRATMSAVGSSSTSDIWEFSGTVDDTASVSSADDTVFDGEGSGNVAPGTLSFGAFDGDLPGTYGRTPEADSVLAVAAGPSPLGFAPADNPLPSISRDQLDVERIRPFTIGARQYVAPTPPAPAPATPASPPREVTAVAGVQSAVVSWAAPSSSGSFPVTSYQVTSSPGGHGCLVSAPALTCTITGLTAGDSYTFVAKALTGAGWSSSSAPSNAVVPEGQPDAKAILITSSRDRIAPSIVRVDGTTTGLVGEQVTPQVRKPGQTGFTPGSNVRTVDANGRFTWQRKSGKKLYVYFTSGDVRSNRLVIGPA